MQTVYLLKGCYKSYVALKKLYNYPDLSTNIIIVDNEHAKILLLDKRVKKFPFIINTLPTSIGLVPKIAKVLPLEMFLLLKKFHEDKICNKERIIKVPISEQNPTFVKKYIPTRQPEVKNVNKRRSNFLPVVKTVRSTDGGVNIILNK